MAKTKAKERQKIADMTLGELKEFIRRVRCSVNTKCFYELDGKQRRIIITRIAARNEAYRR